MSKRNLNILLLTLGISPYLVNGYINSLIYEVPVLYWSFELITWVLVPTGILYLLQRFGDLKVEDLGFSGLFIGRRRVGLIVLVGFFCAPIGYVIFSIFLSLGEVLFPRGALFFYQQIVPSHGLERYVVALYFAVSAGLVEEFYFRGLAYKIAEKFEHPLMVYFLFSPLLFAIVHWESGLPTVFGAYFFGIVSAALFLWFRNLWPLVISHMFTDYMYFG